MRERFVWPNYELDKEFTHFGKTNNMKIGIIGQGFVGNAVYQNLKKVIKLKLMIQKV